MHHLFKAKEMLASTLCTIHNQRFIVTLVDSIRTSIDDCTFDDFRADFLGRYYATTRSRDTSSYLCAGLPDFLSRHLR